jgi:hypothetical protein
MSNDFRRAYADLKDFIARNSEIEIGESVVSIPENIRPEFYRFFNGARAEFVKEHFSAFLLESKSLIECYREIEAEVIQSLGLEEIAMDASLQRFMHDPIERLARESFDLLFDLLKGRESFESFERKTHEAIEALLPSLFSMAYEKWAVLSLVKLLQSDRAFQVKVRELYPGERIKATANPMLNEVPSPNEAKSLSFEHNRQAVFMVPDFIVHSANMNSYAGFRCEFKTALFKASNASSEREWHSVEPGSIVAMEPGLALVYVADTAEHIALVADAGRICRPDLIFWCIEPGERRGDEIIKTMKLHHDRLNPKMGSYIITKKPFSESEYVQSGIEMPQKSDNRMQDIHVLAVQFDASKLAPVVDALMCCAAG